MKYRNILMIGLTVALAACTTPAPVITAPSCPAVPECRIPQPEIRTNGQLAQAYLDTRHELQQCKTARDTLSQCQNPNREEQKP
ncbi:MAG: Rz1-like lysis system protein LysC [Neisseria sp.]|nr:Rz1-like lysis system protein LysC [Neisseria sp.]